MDLSGKVALVTGGAVRVGRAIVLALADAGADVAFSYHSSAGPAEEVAREVRERGRNCYFGQTDQAKPEEVSELVDAVVSQLGRLDVLVNSASIFRRTPWPDIDVTDWDAVLDTNLKGPFLCARQAAPHLAQHGDGAIINIVDLAAWRPFPNLMVHSIAKAGLLNLTHSLAVELAPAVRVNALAPGMILPPPNYSQAMIDAAARGTLLQRWGDPNDVAEAVVYLARASYVTGAVLTVDGGEMLARR